MGALDKNRDPFVANLRRHQDSVVYGGFQMASMTGQGIAAVVGIGTSTMIAGEPLVVAAGFPSNCMHVAAEVELD